MDVELRDLKHLLSGDFLESCLVHCLLHNWLCPYLLVHWLQTGDDPLHWLNI
jgi:hypothetical protein